MGHRSGLHQRWLSLSWDLPTPLTTTPSADFSTPISPKAQSGLWFLLPRRDTVEISQGKPDRLRYTTAGSTFGSLGRYGLRDHRLARPLPPASYPVLVHRLVALLGASFTTAPHGAALAL